MNPTPEELRAYIANLVDKLGAHLIGQYENDPMEDADDD